jgi:hypothetical protein
MSFVTTIEATEAPTLDATDLTSLSISAIESVPDACGWEGNVVGEAMETGVRTEGKYLTNAKDTAAEAAIEKTTVEMRRFFSGFMRGF